MIQQHGTHRGYIQGCRDDCCRLAHSTYMNLYRMGRRNRIINAQGTHRRIHALQFLGWSHLEIATAAGHPSRDWSHDLLKRGRVTARSALAVCKAYETLSMTLPPDAPYTTRTRNHARARGWVGPLSWDDIDRDELPRGLRREHTAYDSRDLVDPATVLRILAGDRVPANTAERDEAMRRWKASGKPERELCERLGWKEARYGRQEQTA